METEGSSPSRRVSARDEGRGAHTSPWRSRGATLSDFLAFAVVTRTLLVTARVWWQVRGWPTALHPSEPSTSVESFVES